MYNFCVVHAKKLINRIKRNCNYLPHHTSITTTFRGFSHSKKNLIPSNKSIKSDSCGKFFVSLEKFYFYQLRKSASGRIVDV